MSHRNVQLSRCPINQCNYNFEKNRGAWKTKGRRGTGGSRRRGRGAESGRRGAAAPTSRESRGLYITAIVPPTYITRWLAAVVTTQSLARFRALSDIAHLCLHLLHTHLSAMTVTSKMNSVSRQSMLSRLGPGGLLYAANKILAVRHRNVLSVQTFYCVKVKLS